MVWAVLQNCTIASIRHRSEHSRHVFRGYRSGLAPICPWPTPCAWLTQHSPEPQPCTHTSPSSPSAHPPHRRPAKSPCRTPPAWTSPNAAPSTASIMPPSPISPRLGEERLVSHFHDGKPLDHRKRPSRKSAGSGLDSRLVVLPNPHIGQLIRHMPCNRRD